MEASPKKFSGVGMAVRKEPAVIRMNHVGSITVDQNVTVTVKVITADLPQEVNNRDGKSLTKQYCVVGDYDRFEGVVVWEGDGGWKKL